MSPVEVDPTSARIMYLCRLGIIRELKPEEALELAQLEAAEKAEPQPQEARQ